ncbi:hypothetical protein BDZ94DRAFT_387626 [Collybia nuda]|uniref:DUF6533 domain-containing protein n=1 Tax=Collybia nuda TaxID=64659 RepID=A0A9P6CGN8_9AGAR|nr:hypothetical protein BDZ94DRAFT_387626 [Collybia nuda]
MLDQDKPILCRVRFATLASAIVLIWDVLLTMDLEVSRVWSGKLSLGTILFMMNRYLPIVLIVFQVIWLGGIVTFGIAQSLLITRTHALYRNRYLLVALLMMWFGSIVMMATIFLYLFIKFVTVLPANPFVPGCSVPCFHPICRTLIKIFSVPFFGLETVIFMLTVYKTYETYQLTGRKHLSYLSKIISRDGLMYYIIIISLAIFNITLWWAGPENLGDLGQSLMTSIQATVCSRLFLNLRKMLGPQHHPALNLTKILESYQQRQRGSMERETISSA